MTFTFGHNSRIFTVASAPLSRGIEMSMSTMSGSSSFACCHAAMPLSASPTTSMFGCSSISRFEPFAQDAMILSQKDSQFFHAQDLC